MRLSVCMLALVVCVLLFSGVSAHEGKPRKARGAQAGAAAGAGAGAALQPVAKADKGKSQEPSASSSASASSLPTFDAFKSRFPKHYASPAAEAAAKAAFEANMKLAAQRSSAPSDSKKPGRFGMTQFSDIPVEVFVTRRLGGRSRRIADRTRIQGGVGAQRKHVDSGALPAKYNKQVKYASKGRKGKLNHSVRFLSLASEANGPPPPPKPSGGATVNSGGISTTYNKQNGNGAAQVSLGAGAIKRYQLTATTTSAGTFKSNDVDSPVDFTPVLPYVRFSSACSACWAMTAADVVQAAMWRAGKPGPAFSAQYFLDCDDGSWSGQHIDQGCDGGSAMNAMQFTLALAGGGNGLVFLENDYPWSWNAEGVLKCRQELMKNPRNVIADWSWAVYPTHSLSLSTSDSLSGTTWGNPKLALGAPGSPTASLDREVLLARALNKYGPLGVVVDGTGLQQYTGGITTAKQLGCSSDPAKGSHAMMLVGLAKDPSGAQYWVLKNSWGTDWGESGYLYLARGGDPCGITTTTMYVNIAGDGSTQSNNHAKASAMAYGPNAINGITLPPQPKGQSQPSSTPASTSTSTSGSASSAKKGGKAKIDCNDLPDNPTPAWFKACPPLK